MTRNSRKFQKQTNQEEKQTTKESILSKLSFISSTETVKLPTEGLYYSKDNPLYGISEVEVKHMTAKEEDMLSSLTSGNSKDLFTRIVQSILVRPEVDATLFCEQDLTAILLSARMTGFGQTFTTSELCLGCGDMTTFEFDLAKQEVIHDNKEKVSFDSETNSIEVVLPILETKVKIRMLSDSDLDALEKEKKKKEELGLVYNKTTSFLNAALLSVDDSEDKELKKLLLDKMPAVDALFLKEIYLDFRPKISTLQAVECQSCGAVNRKEVPTSWAFFRPDKSIY